LKTTKINKNKMVQMITRHTKSFKFTYAKREKNNKFKYFNMKNLKKQYGRVEPFLPLFLELVYPGTGFVASFLLQVKQKKNLEQQKIRDD